MSIELTISTAPSTEHTRQIALAKRFLSELVQVRGKVACAICTLLLLACESHIMTLPDLKQSGLLNSLSNAVHRIALASSALIIDNSMIVCRECMQQLQASIVPDFMPTTKWALSLVPRELTSLTLLEQLLITKCFHVKHVLNYAWPNDGNSLAYKVSIKPFASTSYYQMNTLPISPVPLSLVFEIVAWLNPHNNTNRFDCLVVCEARICNALFWLKAHNQYYSDINLSLDALAQLPINRIPQHCLTQLLGPKGLSNVFSPWIYF
jgi:hypothetical protein